MSESELNPEEDPFPDIPDHHYYDYSEEQMDMLETIYEILGSEIKGKINSLIVIVGNYITEIAELADSQIAKSDDGTFDPEVLPEDMLAMYDEHDFSLGELTAFLYNLLFRGVFSVTVGEHEDFDPDVDGDPDALVRCPACCREVVLDMLVMCQKYNVDVSKNGLALLDNGDIEVGPAPGCDCHDCDIEEPQKMIL